MECTYLHRSQEAQGFVWVSVSVTSIHQRTKGKDVGPQIHIIDTRFKYVKGLFQSGRTRPRTCINSAIHQSHCGSLNTVVQGQGVVGFPGSTKSHNFLVQVAVVCSWRRRLHWASCHLGWYSWWFLVPFQGWRVYSFFFQWSWLKSNCLIYQHTKQQELMISSCCYHLNPGNLRSEQMRMI